MFIIYYRIKNINKVLDDNNTIAKIHYYLTSNIILEDNSNYLLKKK